MKERRPYLQLRCPGWRSEGWWSRSSPGSSWCFRPRFLPDTTDRGSIDRPSHFSHKACYSRTSVPSTRLCQHTPTRSCTAVPKTSPPKFAPRVIIWHDWNCTGCSLPQGLALMSGGHSTSTHQKCLQNVSEALGGGFFCAMWQKSIEWCYKLK